TPGQLAAAQPAQPVATPAAASSPTAAATTGQDILLNGAGSTFDNPLFSKAFSEYGKLHPNVKVNYQAVGSGAGIQQLTKGTVDFGATDVPLKSSEADAMGGSDKVIQLAGTLGTESLAYNLQGVSDGQLKLTTETIAGIFLGK